MKKRKAQWGWVYSPPKSKITDDIKQEVAAKAEEILVEWRKKFIREPPKDYDFNYIVEFYGKWFRNYFYFCAKYACPSPRSIAPFFEAKFTRIECVNNERFNLAYMRHTEKWCEVEQGLTLDTCMKKIREDYFYHPS